MDKQRFTHVSLFSGAGGLDIGFENVGFASQEGRSLTGVRIETKSPSLIALRRAKTPLTGARIETTSITNGSIRNSLPPPSWGRELKLKLVYIGHALHEDAPFMGT